MRMGRWAMVAVAAGAVTLIGAGAFAAGTPTAQGGSSRSEAFLSDVASHLGVQPQALKNAIGQADIDRVNELKAAGKISADQAQKMISEIQAGHVRWMGPQGHHGNRAGFAMLGRQVVVQTTANYLGVPQQQVTSDLKSGMSLNQIASSVSGKTPAGLQAALQQAVQTKLGEAVTAGKLTGAQEQKIMARVEKMLPKLMARTWTGHHAPAGSGTASGTASGAASATSAQG